MATRGSGPLSSLPPHARLHLEGAVVGPCSGRAEGPKCRDKETAKGNRHPRLGGQGETATWSDHPGPPLNSVHLPALGSSPQVPQHPSVTSRPNRSTAPIGASICAPGSGDACPPVRTAHPAQKSGRASASHELAERGANHTIIPYFLCLLACDRPCYTEHASTSGFIPEPVRGKPVPRSATRT